MVFAVYTCLLIRTFVRTIVLGVSIVTIASSVSSHVGHKSRETHAATKIPFGGAIVDRITKYIPLL